MYLMFGDEADHVQSSKKKFFVYGAIFVPVNSIKALHTEIALARAKAGLANTDSLKSASSARPKDVSVEDYRSLKNAYRPGRNAQQAAVEVDKLLLRGHPEVVDADLAEHMCSVADVLLGAFRYCVNEPDDEEAGKAMYPIIVGMMWNHERDGKTVLHERGLVFRPMEKSLQYQAEYDALSERLLGYLS
jgi:hypothetical protein